MGTLILILIVFVICAAYEVPAYLGRFMPRRRRFRHIERVALNSLRHFVAAARTYMGIRLVREEGCPLPAGPCIVIANHQSLLDIPVLMHSLCMERPVRFVAKKELGYGIPMISSVLKLGGHALVSRGGDAASSMRELGAFARRCARDGASPVLFPEGTRSRDGRLGRFHSAGLRRLLDLAPVPVLVVAMDGGWLMSNLRRVLTSSDSCVYRVRVLAVLDPPSGRRGAAELLDTASGLIAAQLERWRSTGGS